MYNLNDFIAAYTWAYGETKKKAREVYKKANEEYKRAIIDEYKNNCRKVFYED